MLILLNRQTILTFNVILVSVIALLQSALPLWYSAILILLLLYRWPLQQSSNTVNKLKRVNIIAALILLLLLVSIKQSGVFHLMLQILLLSAASRLVLVRQRKDSHQLLWVLYFLLACCFIFYQSIMISLLIMTLLLLTLYCHYQLYASKNQRIQLVQIGKALLITMPVWLTLFLLFPRLQPLWQIPTAQAAITGLADTLDPGSIENLVQSDALAFRVVFNTLPPPRQEWYWRAKVYENFDGRSWTVNPRFLRAQLTKQATSSDEAGTKVSYQIIAEVSNQRSLFALSEPLELSSEIRPTAASLIEARRPVSQRLSYRLTSTLNKVPADSADETQLNLRTANANPQTRALARKWAENGYSTPEIIVQISNLFRQQPFYYSLNPPRLGANSVDAFLFDSRTGFCSHYASATAVILREAGIAARVVGGYQGGVWHEDQQYLEVRQREAHAWVEYFDQNRWQRFDPTAVIAPERVLAGLDAVLSADEQNQLHANWRRFSAINFISQQFLHLDYYWSVWVLGFDDSQQRNLWQQLKAASKFIALLGIVVLIALLLTWYRYYTKRPAKLAAPVLLLQRYLQKMLVYKALSQSHSAFILQLSNYNPAQALLLADVDTLYQRALFAEDQYAMQQLKTLLQCNRKQLAGLNWPEPNKQSQAS